MLLTITTSDVLIGILETKDPNWNVQARICLLYTSYVCPYCGYTYGIHDRILNKNGKEDKKATNDRLAGFETIEIKRVHQNRCV